MPGTFFKRFLRFLLAIIILLNIGCTSGEKQSEEQKVTPVPTGNHIPTPPKAPIIPKELTLHQTTRIDNYFWINQRDNPKVMDYLKEENHYLKAMLTHTEGLQDKLYNEIISRLKQEDQTAPYLSNGYVYYSRYLSGSEYPVHCRRKGSMDAPEEVMLNVNEMAAGHPFYALNDHFMVTMDNIFLAYGVDELSRRKYTIHIKNLKTGETLPEKIPNTNGIPVWANDNQTLFYITKDDTLREYKVFSHRIGTPVSQDREIYHEADDTFSINLSKSLSNAYIFIESYSTLSSEYRYLDAGKPENGFTVIEPRQKDVEYDVAHHDDKWIILTNWQAKNFRIMEVGISQPGKSNWQEIIPHLDDVLLEEMAVFKGYLVIRERKSGLPHLRVMEWKSKDSYYIAFEQPTYTVWIDEHQKYDSLYCRYSFESLATPETLYDYHMKIKEKKLLKQDYAGGGFDPANYETHLLWATARDGVKVPISLFYQKGLEKNGNNPLFLYGYGSYGYSWDVEFEPGDLSLVDRGFIYAIAHIRGGSEMGRHWYEEGKLFKKKNTFNDFIDCAEFLVAEKYTNPAKLFAQGGSAGGLLIGAVVNMRPDLFKAVIANVPFVDVVTTMLDTSIPLTTAEFDEWGNPANKEYFEYMLSYSPYDNVEAKDYPAMLVTTGLHDSQVQYWEPAKWVAKLRAMKTDHHPLLLKVDMDAGHGGASGRYKKYKLMALSYAFVLDQLGVKE